jgi:hypothetical protein
MCISQWAESCHVKLEKTADQYGDGACGEVLFAASADIRSSYDSAGAVRNRGRIVPAGRLWEVGVGEATWRYVIRRGELGMRFGAMTLWQGTKSADAVIIAAPCCVGVVNDLALPQTALFSFASILNAAFSRNLPLASTFLNLMSQRCAVA